MNVITLRRLERERHVIVGCPPIVGATPLGFTVSQPRGPDVIGTNLQAQQSDTPGAPPLNPNTNQPSPFEQFLFDTTDPIFGPQSMFGSQVQALQKRFGVDPHTGAPTTTAMATGIVTLIVVGIIVLIIVLKVVF